MYHKGPSLYYIRVFWGFFEHPPTYVRTFSLHKVRKNCHFMDHPPIPMSLRNIKMDPKEQWRFISLSNKDVVFSVFLEKSGKHQTLKKKCDLQYATWILNSSNTEPAELSFFSLVATSPCSGCHVNKERHQQKTALCKFSPAVAAYSRLWKKRCPWNKRSPWNIWQKH